VVLTAGERMISRSASKIEAAMRPSTSLGFPNSEFEERGSAILPTSAASSAHPLTKSTRCNSGFFKPQS
jgi:hypothetical protein